MNLLDLLQMTKGQPVQQAENSIGPIMQFLAQHRSQPMAPLQMPNMPDHSGMIMQAELQRQARQGQYAAHLRAKAQLEAQQAAAIAGHEAELSDDPQVQAMLRSGNPQLVAYAMKIAEDEKQKKIAAQYNENATFAMYDKLVQEGTPESLAKAARMMEFKKAGATNINMGEKTANDIVWMTPEQKVAAGLDPGQPYAINQKSGMPEAVKPNEFTDAQNVATGYYNRMLSAEQVLDAEMAAGFETGSPKEAIANALPYGLGGLLRTPQMQRVRQAQEDWVRAKLRKESGAAIPPDEMDREIQTYFPGLNETDPSIIEQKRRSRQKAVEQLYEATGGKQSAGTNPYIAKVVDAGKGYNVVETADGTLLKQEGDRATRNNNPGNLEYRGQNGAIGSDGRFAIFQSKEAGSQAMANLLFNSDLYGNLRLSEAIHKYAPPVENNTSGYLSRVLAAVGNKNKPMSQYSPEERAAIIRAMESVEGNKPIKTTVLQQHKDATKMASTFTKNSPANKDKKAELEKRAAALGW